ncbi:DUF1850 domain-containing protein [Acetomicrobium sp. S15 = DSM 107314]|uniref:DUF1850 domain-containing protein n=1 Tax=Acetomicrobium sp. S15 = DSM 107314 TaxID=2529858 RepID=UPI0018E16F05|nr:DUF1850 domain-containing protein [Acetomicrobium sp. S15 = DSM 107314]
MYKYLFRRIILAIFVLVGLVVFLLPVSVLIIKEYSTGAVLFRACVPHGYSFATKIRHSVHLTPVYEYFRVGAHGQLIITGTAFKDLGWGVPSTFRQNIKFENGFMVVNNINKPIDFIPFRVNLIAKPHLILGKLRDVDLLRYVIDGGRIDISIQRVPYIILLIRGEIDEFKI